MLVWVDRALKRKSHSCSRNGDNAEPTPGSFGADLSRSDWA